MKKILIFSVAYHPFVGGAEVAVKEITDRISDISFDMITLNLDGRQSAQEKIGSVTVYRIGGKGRLHKLLFPFTAFLKAQKLHKKNNYNAIWSIMASFSGFAALFFKLKNKKIPFILTLQEGDPIPDIKRQVRFVYPLFKRIFTKADKIQAISHYLADFARDMGAKASVTVIPNGVDVKLFTQAISEQDKVILKSELNKQDKDVFLITTSRLVEKNGIKDIINSLTFLPSFVKLLIIGVGPLEQELRHLARENNVGDRVLFLGFIDYKKIPEYLAVSDIFIRPSLSEGMGNSFIEAMAAKVPVIATNVGGIPDFLKDNETGLFCEVKNPKSIAEKVNFLIHNEELKANIKAQANSLAVNNYDWSLISQQMHDKILAN